MALVRNQLKHTITLTHGSIAPGEDLNVDLGLAYEASLVASGDLIIIDAGVDPPPPPTKSAGVRAVVPYANPDPFVIDLSGAIAGQAIGVDGHPVASENPLAPTAVKTAAYAAGVQELVPVDASAGSVTVTLPSAPADKTRVAVKVIAIAIPYTVTVARGGSDVFNKAGGSTSLTLSLLNQGVLLQYKASSGIWYVLAVDIPTNGSTEADVMVGRKADGSPRQTWKPPADLTGNQVNAGIVTLPWSYASAAFNGTQRVARIDIQTAVGSSADYPAAARVLFKASIPQTTANFGTATLKVGMRKSDGTTVADGTVDVAVFQGQGNSADVLNYYGMVEIETGINARYLDVFFSFPGSYTGTVTMHELDIRLINEKGRPLRLGGNGQPLLTAVSNPGAEVGIDMQQELPDGRTLWIRRKYGVDNGMELALIEADTFYGGVGSHASEPGIGGYNPFFTSLNQIQIHVNNNDLVWNVKRPDNSFELRGNTHGGEVGRTASFKDDYLVEFDRGDGNWVAFDGGTNTTTKGATQGYRVRITQRTKVTMTGDTGPFANIDRVSTFFPDGVVRVDRTITMLKAVTFARLFYIMDSIDPGSGRRGRQGVAQRILKEMNGQRADQGSIALSAQANAGASAIVTAAAAQLFSLWQGSKIKIGTGGSAETKTVTSVSGSTINLDSALANTWPIGTTAVLLDDPTTLAAAAAAGSSSISLANTVGRTATLVVDPGPREERFQLASFVSGSGPFTATLQGTFARSHPNGAPVHVIYPGDDSIRSANCEWGVYQEPTMQSCFGQVYDRREIESHGLGPVTTQMVRNTISNYIHKMYSYVFPATAQVIPNGTVLTDTWFWLYYSPRNRDSYEREAANLASLIPADRKAVYS